MDSAVIRRRCRTLLSPKALLCAASQLRAAAAGARRLHPGGRGSPRRWKICAGVPNLVHETLPWMVRAAASWAAVGATAPLASKLEIWSN